MAKINIVRKHDLDFLEARHLAKSWIEEGQTKYGLQGEYVEGEQNDKIVFSRKGLSGLLVVTNTKFTLDLTLGFLLSAYQHKIVTTIHKNMDDLLR